jgi:putative heme iron utilization protein
MNARETSPITAASRTGNSGVSSGVQNPDAGNLYTGQPNVSYAPFAWNEHGCFILVSEIARHARNLKQHPQLSFMLIEDEQHSRQLYARRRLTFDASAALIERDSLMWQTGILALQERHGALVADLANMADFSLFCLQPESGLYVKGFGQAFEVSGQGAVDIVHLDQGHRPVSGTQLPQPEAVPSAE